MRAEFTLLAAPGELWPGAGLPPPAPCRLGGMVGGQGEAAQQQGSTEQEELVRSRVTPWGQASGTECTQQKCWGRVAGNRGSRAGSTVGVGGGWAPHEVDSHGVQARCSLIVCLTTLTACRGRSSVSGHTSPQGPGSVSRTSVPCRTYDGAGFPGRARRGTWTDVVCSPLNGRQKRKQGKTKTQRTDVYLLKFDFSRPWRDGLGTVWGQGLVCAGSGLTRRC